MTQTIKRTSYAGRGEHDSPSEPSSIGGFHVQPRIKDYTYRGVRFVTARNPDGYVGIVDTGDKVIPLTHPDGKAFQHNQSAINCAKTVIRWHQKFGGWRIPK